MVSPIQAPPHRPAVARPYPLPLVDGDLAEGAHQAGCPVGRAELGGGLQLPRLQVVRAGMAAAVLAAPGDELLQVAGRNHRRPLFRVVRHGGPISSLFLGHTAGAQLRPRSARGTAAHGDQTHGRRRRRRFMRARPCRGSRPAPRRAVADGRDGGGREVLCRGPVRRGAAGAAVDSLLALPSFPLNRVPQQHIYMSSEQLHGYCNTLLFQCFTTLSVQKFFLIPTQNLLCCKLRPFPLVQFHRKKDINKKNDSLHLQ